MADQAKHKKKKARKVAAPDEDGADLAARIKRSKK